MGRYFSVFFSHARVQLLPSVYLSTRNAAPVRCLQRRRAEYVELQAEVNGQRRALASGSAPAEEQYSRAKEAADDAHDELYFASVLILDTEDSAEAMRARDLLEQAGYFVDVEWDGRKCIELLLFEGRQYDALLIDRDSAVSDAFEVTEAIRKQERERR